MAASRAGLFESLRQLLNTALELAQVRLELLVADLQIEKLRLADAALRALLGVLMLGLGLMLLIGFVLMLLGPEYRLPALGVLTLVFLLGGLGLLQAAKRRLLEGEEMFAATRGELQRDQAQLQARD